jgi:serine protease Do
VKMLKSSYIKALLCCFSALLYAVCLTTVSKAQQQGFPSFAFGFNNESYIGIQYEDITSQNYNKYGLSEVKGVVVKEVVAGSPAEKAGLKPGDVILKINGEDVTSGRKLSRMISEIAPDHKARILVSRQGKETEIAVTVGRRSSANAFEGAFTFPGIKRMETPGGLWDKLQKVTPGAFTLTVKRQIGVSVYELTEQLKKHFGVSNGVLVSEVGENSPAARAGIQSGDIILEADGKAINDQFDLIKAINEKETGSVRLVVNRSGSRQEITVEPEAAKGIMNFYYRISPPNNGPKPDQDLKPPVAPKAFSFGNIFKTVI